MQNAQNKYTKLNTIAQMHTLQSNLGCVQNYYMIQVVLVRTLSLTLDNNLRL